MRNVLMLSAVVLLSACASQPVPPPKHSILSTAPKNKEPPRVVVSLTQEQQEAGVKAVKATLKDPYSAVFEELYGTTNYPDEPKTYSVCGSVNAKNGYGAYNGLRKFAVVGGNPYVWSDRGDGFASIDNQFIDNLCSVGR